MIEVKVDSNDAKCNEKKRPSCNQHVTSNRYIPSSFLYYSIFSKYKLGWLSTKMEHCTKCGLTCMYKSNFTKISYCMYQTYLEEERQKINGRYSFIAKKYYSETRTLSSIFVCAKNRIKQVYSPNNFNHN